MNDIEKHELDNNTFEKIHTLLQDTQLLKNITNLHQEQLQNDKKTKPKNPINAYIYFCNKHRPLLKEQGVKSSVIKQQLGELWKKSSADIRKEFDDLALIDKNRYTVECENLKNT